MAHLITFSTGLFEASKEEPNPINPIAGQAVLNWLRGKLGTSGYTTTQPEAEDWGWYMDIEGDGSSYMVGASGQSEESAPDIGWTVQIHRHRSFKDRLMGRNKLGDDDPLIALLETIVRSEPAFRDINVERDR